MHKRTENINIVPPVPATSEHVPTKPVNLHLLFIVILVLVVSYFSLDGFFRGSIEWLLSSRMVGIHPQNNMLYFFVSLLAFHVIFIVVVILLLLRSIYANILAFISLVVEIAIMVYMLWLTSNPYIGVINNTGMYITILLCMIGIRIIIRK
jgi:hypothetical protein